MSKKEDVEKPTLIDFEFAFALEGTLSEWSSKNDEESYGRLQLEAALKDEKKATS